MLTIIGQQWPIGHLSLFNFSQKIAPKTAHFFLRIADKRAMVHCSLPTLQASWMSVGLPQIAISTGLSAFSHQLTPFECQIQAGGVGDTFVPAAGFVGLEALEEPPSAWRLPMAAAIHRPENEDLGFINGGTESSVGLILEKQARLQAIYNKHPAIETEFSKTQWSDYGKLRLLDRIAENAGQYAAWAYDDLPAAIKALNKTDWSSEHKYQLLLHLAEKAGKFVYRAYYHLHETIKILNDTDWSYKQKCQFILHLAEKADGNHYAAYGYFHETIKALNDTDWSYEQKCQLLLHLVEKAGVYLGLAYIYLPAAIKALNETDWSSDQKYQLLLHLAEKANELVSSVYKNLPATIKALNETDWSSDQKYQLLLHLAEKANELVASVYKNLPATIKALNDTDWSYEQKCQLLLHLVEKAGIYIGWAYEHLPTAIKALNKTDWNSDQKYQFLMHLAGRARIRVCYIYAILPAVTRVLGNCKSSPREIEQVLDPMFQTIGTSDKEWEQINCITMLIKSLAPVIPSHKSLAETLRLLLKQPQTAKDASSLLTSLESMKLWLTLQKKGFAPTKYLMQTWAVAEDPEALASHWRSVLATIEKGQFDPENELHRNLEYTRFRQIVDHEKVRRHIKNHFAYEQYEEIFRRPSNPALVYLPARDRFEIECAAHESRLLGDFIDSIAAQTKRLGRSVMVVPNFSYGYLPVAPLIEGLEKKGIEVAIGVKVGSTDCHKDKEVINSRLFKKYRGRIVQDQPLLVVADGTQHLVDREGDGKSGRYPDAYQGYLNQVIALNDAMGFSDVDYSGVGKNEEDLKRLRETQEFQRLVKVFRELIDSQEAKTREPYTFHLWNAAGLHSIIRGRRKELARLAPMDAENLEGPAVIFCNVGVLDSQIPESIKAKYPDQTHTPAYFDDSNRIIAFDFGHDKFGVHYLNRLEMEIKKAYGHSDERRTAISGLITRLKRKLPASGRIPVEPLGASAHVYAGE